MVCDVTKQPEVERAAYHAVKGGVVNYTRALAAEWGARGVTVNAVLPVDGGMTCI